MDVNNSVKSPRAIHSSPFHPTPPARPTPSGSCGIRRVSTRVEYHNNGKLASPRRGPAACKRSAEWERLVGEPEGGEREIVRRWEVAEPRLRPSLHRSDTGMWMLELSPRAR